jgi:hypothetical protein
MGHCSSHNKKSYYCANCKDEAECKCTTSKKDKIMISLMSALLFIVIAHPETFKIVRRIFGSWVSTPTGCPSVEGLLLHGVVFFCITLLLMNVNKREKAEGAEEPPVEEVVEEDVVVEEEDAPAPVPPPTPVVEPMSAVAGFDMTEEEVTAPVLTGEVVDPVMFGSQKFTGSYSECECDNGGKVLILK